MDKDHEVREECNVGWVGSFVRTNHLAFSISDLVIGDDAGIR